jgi:hypothetical protein
LVSSLWTRSSFTLSEAQDQVLGDLGLRSNTIITSGDIGTWLNRAQRRIAVDTRSFITSWNIATVSGTAEYVMPSDAGGRAISILELLFKNVPLRPVNMAQLYSWNYKWHSQAAGTPLAFWQHGAGSIGVYPAPSSSGTSDLVAWAIAIPPVVTAPEDFFYIPHGCEDALIAYAELRAAVKDAFGEGKDRIPILAAEWKSWELRVQQIVREAQASMIVRMGEDAIVWGDWGPYSRGFFWNPGDIATPRS